MNNWTNDCFFTFDQKSKNKINFTGKLRSDASSVKQFFSLKQDLYPYLLVNLRSGCNFIRVDSKDKHSRICGSTIGIHMFLGVLRLLNLFNNDPTSAVNGAMQGDSGNVDMNVGDIYGGDYG